MRISPLLNITLLLTVASLAWAQSHDIQNPTPLGPGVNKGNLTNQNAPVVYYFIGGPGKFDLHFAFHEMGMFANPLRQSMSFDIIDPTGKVQAHDVVRSFGNTARFTHPGLNAAPKRYLIRVAAQQGPIRLGGYYEIEVTGVTTFEGKTVGENVRPLMSPALIHPN